jgi:hypothetical protein
VKLAFVVGLAGTGAALSIVIAYPQISYPQTWNTAICVLKHVEDALKNVVKWLDKGLL